MQEQDIHHILATLKDVAQTTQDNGHTSGDALARVSAAMAQEGLRQIVGPTMLSPDDPVVDPSRLLQSVLEAIERSGIALEDSPEKARLMIEIGEILYIQGKWDDAIERFEQAADISTRIDFPIGKANALRQTGRIKRRRGDWVAAQKILKEAVDLYHDLEDQAGKAEALLNLGNIRYEQGQYDKAEALFQDALLASEHLDSNQLIGDISMSLGVIRHVMGHNDEAITHFTESLANFEVIADQRRISQACHNLGLAYAAQGMWARAGMMYERALDIGRDLGEWSMVGLVYLCRSEMQALLADTAMAMGYAHKALEIFERLKDPLGQADAYKVFGRISGLKNAWDLAEELLDESERLQREHGSRLGEAEVEEVRGWLHERRQNYDEAMEAYQRAMMIFHEMKAMGGAKRVRDAILHLQETTADKK